MTKDDIHAIKVLAGVFLGVCLIYGLAFLLVAMGK